uniref:Uncharacterized protein n=1 Tax=Pseudo-nitzschia australis TaxID=44445 RepID=A0A7S4AW26_9STRA|mmetsp:Transcript_22629/g.47477  ORF Transcript_22629/g.47477 Transcript_22629/m.47477 type:complete len:203 (-) Transcript_22629:1392-2000(-)
MAFEQNLEADRIEGFNIFSAFVRVPLLVLGGILGGDGSSSFNNVDSDDSLMSHSLSRSMDVDLNNSATNNNSDVQFHGAATDCTRPLNQQQTLNMTSINHSIQREKPDCRADHTHNNQGMKRTKTMSWSDESGLPLVYENDEVRAEKFLLYRYYRCLFSRGTFYSVAFAEMRSVVYCCSLGWIEWIPPLREDRQVQVLVPPT